MSDKQCNTCLFFYTQDTGYSNWTVEGTDAYCLLNKNPHFPIDTYYDQEIALTKICNTYEYTEHKIRLDIDREEGDFENYVDDHKLKAYIRMNPKLTKGL